MIKITIAGFGFVGQAVYASLKDSDNVFIYDRYKPGFTNPDVLEDSDFVFCCVPSPMDKKTGKQVFTEVEFLLSFLADKNYSGIVVMKSTVLFSNIEPWMAKLNIVLNPEFLNQNSAADDFRNQPMIVLGGLATDCHDVKRMYLEMFELCSPSFQFVTASEACWFKYLHNTYHAYQVLFWNYAHQLTGNSRKYAALYEKLYGRKPILSQVCADGQPGYGGACFPKDVNALQADSPHLLTQFMCEFNRHLRPADEPDPNG